jgi:hypothetical protein
MSQTDGDVFFAGPQGAIKKIQHLGSGVHAEVVSALAPDEIAFYAGREFRTFKEFEIAPAGSYNIKVVAEKDTIVYQFGCDIQSGEIKIELVTGGTEGGSYTTEIPVFPTNSMSFTPQVATAITMNANGTHSGGTVVDLLYANAGAENKAVQATATEDYPQAFAAGTFYIRIINTSTTNVTAKGIFRARWEER